MNDESRELVHVKKAKELKEFIGSHTEKLGTDFQRKARSVFQAMAGDFISRGIDGNDEIWIHVSSSEDAPLFKSKASHSYLKRLEKLIEDRVEYHDNAKYAASVMDVFAGIVKLYPDRIPKYFIDYKIDPDLTCIQGQTLTNDSRKYYWADGSIERYQDEIESIIIFALEQSKLGKSLPSDFTELKNLYLKSIAE